MKQHILIIGYVWVEPNSSAAGSRMLQLITLFLKHNFKVTYASPAQKSDKAVDLGSLGVEEKEIELNSSSFDDFISECNPTIVMFDRFMMEEQFGWRVAENCPNALRILDTEDLHFLRKVRHQLLKEEKEFSIEALLLSEEAKREITSILRCDMTLIISTFESKLLKEVFKVDEALIYHLPFLLNPIDTSITQQWRSFSERKHFAFIGNFFHAPNVDAVVHLKKSIWPVIRKQLPKAELHVYGAYVNQQIQQLHKPQEGFCIKGFAPDAMDVISASKVVLAPLRFGAGIKGKLTEAMLCGTPSVTTTIGAEGMHDDLPWSGSVEDDVVRFSELAVALYTNEQLWQESQKNGIRIINEIYNKNKLEATFIQAIENLLNRLKEHRNQNFIGSLLHYKTLQATKYMSKWIEEKNKK